MESEKDYKKIGFKCGLELHIQLDTHKLFCDCDSRIREDKPDMVVRRNLHSVAGEMGCKDVAAEAEETKGKTFVYESYVENNCLVELDEEPPHEMNNEAIDIALQFAMLLHMRPVDEIRVMRKTVIDGSNTSGFQRTALVATDGYVESSLGKVRVSSLCLEEDSARIMKEEGDKIYFRLDRLGIPLVELRTEPDIKTPEHAREIAKKLGNLSRVLQVKRGIGTIRQDVNVSTKGGSRIEIKGFQDLRKMPRIIEGEIKRQQKVIKSGKKVEPHVRRVNADGSTSFMRPMPGSARMYPETDVPPIPVTNKILKRIEKSLPKHPDEVAGKLNKLLNSELASQMLRSDKLELFLKIIKRSINPVVVATTILSTEPELKTRFSIKTEIPDEIYEEILWLHSEGKVPKTAIFEVLLEYAKNPRDLIQILEDFKQVGEEELIEIIKKIIQKKPGLNFSAYMGLVMKELRGRVDGGTIARILKSLL